MKPLSLLQQNLSQALQKEKGLVFVGPLLKKFPRAELYLVGGIVRDWLLDRESKDFDFVVRGIAGKKLEQFLKKYGAVNLVGKRFGVFKFTPKNSDLIIDVALPRTEHAWGTGGYRDVKTQSDWRLPIEADLSRRDFTINAIALKIRDKRYEIRDMGYNRLRVIGYPPAGDLPEGDRLQNTNLIDPSGGLADLQKKLIRTVGRPEERFKEDYSRMLRALRLACQLDFEIEGKTWMAIKKMMGKINQRTNNKEQATRVKIRDRRYEMGDKREDEGPEQVTGYGLRVTGYGFHDGRVVPYEVVAKEFLKSLMANPVRTLDWWDQAGALKELMPELLKMKKCPQPKEFHGEGDVWTHTRLSLANLNAPHFKKFIRTLPKNYQKESPYSPELALATLFHDLGKPYTLKTPEKHGTDRIRTDEHDTVGAMLAKKIGRRLRLNSVPDLPCNLDKVAWLIERHLLTVHGDPHKFTNRTIERYFFNPKNPGGDLLKLIYVDQMASLVKGKPQLGALPRLIRRIKVLPKKLKKKHTLPPPLLNGDEIMEILKIKPGIEVGKIIEELREAQLASKIKNKQEAKRYLKIFKDIEY